MPIPAYLWLPIFVHFSVGLVSMATVLYFLAVLLSRAAKRNQ